MIPEVEIFFHVHNVESVIYIFLAQSIENADFHQGLVVESKGGGDGHIIRCHKKGGHNDSYSHRENTDTVQAKAAPNYMGLHPPKSVSIKTC